MPAPLPVSPYLTRKKEYMPEVGHIIVLEMPGDRGRAEVIRVATEDTVVVKLLTVPVGRNPLGLMKGDQAFARRGTVELTGVECWTIVSEREMQQAESILRLEADAKLRVKLEEEQRIAAQRERDLRHGDPADGPISQPRRVLGPRRNKISKR